MQLLCSALFLAVAIATQPVPTRTIMDVISSSPQFSELVGLLQDRELVPLINESWNCTLLAPVNSAFMNVDKSTITREQLLYHMINDTAYSVEFATHARVYQTFLDEGEAPISLSLASGVNNDVDFDEVDLLASPQRGLVHAVSEVVDIPSTLSKEIYLDRSISSFSSLLDDDVLLKGRTVFPPLDPAFDSWLSSGLGDKNSSQPILNYLQSPFGKRDRKAAVDRHVYPGIIRPKDSPQEIRLNDDTVVTLHKNLSIAGPGFMVDAASQLCVARNGIYFKVDRVLESDPAGSVLDMTPEKFIIGLGGYGLVRAMSLYGFKHLIDGSHPVDAPRSIIVPLSNDQPQVQSIANPGVLILYQFIKGDLPAEGDSFLLDSLMPLRSGRSAQKIHFERRNSGAMTLNWEVLGPDVYQWGNNTFYTSEETLTAPPSLTMALGPMLISSFSISFLDKLNRLQLPFSKSWTVFVPTRDAWEKNMLLKGYLDSNEKALARVFDNLILQAPFYSDSSSASVKQFSGLPTDISWNPQLHQFRLNNSELDTHIETESTDALFDNGVAHIVNTVPLPRDLEVSTSDLIRSGGRKYFLELLRAAGMDDVLEPAANFTILVPPTKDLRKNNYTVATDAKKLQTMLKLHLIPDNPIEVLQDGQNAETLAGEMLEVQAIGAFGKLWGLSPASATSGQRVLIYETGDTNGAVNDGSSVMFIDRHINPQWIVPIRFGLNKGTYAIVGVLIGLVLASGLVFGLVWLVSRQGREAAHDDEEGDYHDEEDEPESARSDARTPEPAPSGPISTQGVSEERSFGRHLDLPH